jgi:hypothetical protein
MPLYDVTHVNKEVLVKPADAENYDVLQGALRVLDARRFAKDIRIIDEALQQAIQHANSKNKLVFTKTGILVGYKSVTPTADTNHIWESALLAYPGNDEHANELQLRFVGGMVRWRIAVLPEMWLVYRRESGKINKFTDKEIRVSEYWINEEFVPRMTHVKHVVGDLMAKFNGARV